MRVNDLKVLMKNHVETGEYKKKCPACGKSNPKGCTKKGCPYRRGKK